MSWLSSPPSDSLPFLDTVRRQKSTSQEAGPQQRTTWPAPWSWASQPSELWEMNSHYSSHPDYSISLWKSKPIHIHNIQKIWWGSGYLHSLKVPVHKVFTNTREREKLCSTAQRVTNHHFHQVNINSNRTSQNHSILSIEFLPIFLWVWDSFKIKSKRTKTNQPTNQKSTVLDFLLLVSSWRAEDHFLMLILGTQPSLGCQCNSFMSTLLCTSLHPHQRKLTTVKNVI